MSYLSATTGADFGRRVFSAPLGAALGQQPGPPTPRCFTLDRFQFDRTALQPFHVPILTSIAANVVATQLTPRPIRSVDVIGHTDVVGLDPYNLDLGRRRAEEVKRQLAAMIDRLHPGLSSRLTFAVQSRGESQPVPGSPERSRRVEVCLPAPPSPPTTVCGPDATNWFIRQVAAAKTDPAVLAIKTDLSNSISAAARRGLNASAMAEGAVANKVLTAERAAGNPPRTAVATTQLAAAAPGVLALRRSVARASVGSPFDGLLLGTLRRAALRWKALVQTGARYDFKNDARTMQGPTSANCPSRPGCPGTLTLCPSTGSDCFLTDVPGNLFYAHVGKFVGWTELALQLGSQFAQLRSTRTWDPPEDTRMISIGFNLPDPLRRADLCAALSSNRSAFVLRPCANCPEQTSASIV